MGVSFERALGTNNGTPSEFSEKLFVQQSAGGTRSGKGLGAEDAGRGIELRLPEQAGNSLGAA